MAKLANVISIPEDSWSFQQSEEVRLEETQRIQDLLVNISPETLQVINRFYNAFRRDIRHILNMYS